jgi:hypothetical protein
MKRRIHKAKIKFLSLVPRGANRLTTILKEDGKGGGTADFDLDMLVQKFDKTKGELLAVVYAPEQRDAHGDIASAAVIKDMLYESAKDGLKIDIRHNEKALTKEQAYPVEQFIIQSNDPRFADTKDHTGNKVDVTGGWGIVLKILDPELIALYESGKWNGVSMAGSALVETEKSTTDGDLDMTPEELKKLLEANNAALLATMQKSVDDALEARGVKKVEKADTKKEEVDPDAPVLEAGASVKDIRKHGHLLKRHKLVKSLTTLEGTKFDAAVVEIEKCDVEIAKLDGKKKDEKKTDAELEIERLEKDIERLRGSSNQGTDDEGDNKDEKNTSGQFVGLHKSEDGDDPVALAALGSKMAKASNAARGLK